MSNNSKDAIEEETSGKIGKKKKDKKPKLTPEQKAIQYKKKVEKAANAKVRKAEADVKRAEQADKNKEKAASKKEKEKEKKASNKIKAKEKKLKQKEKKKEQSEANKIKKQEKKDKIQAEKMQKKAELAARTPLQKKLDREKKIKKLLPPVLILLIVIALVFTGIKFGPKLMNATGDAVSAVTSKIPFLNKQESTKKTSKTEKKTSKSETAAKKATEKKTQTTTEGAVKQSKTINIGGISSVEDYYSVALTKFLKISDKEAKKYCSTANTEDAYTSLIKGDQQVIFATEPKDAEKKMAKKAGLALQSVPVLNGGFVFVVNKDNPVKELTMPQLYGIYSGTITNWKELGGKNEPIVAYQRDENTGGQQGMYTYVIKAKQIMKAPNKMKISDTEGLIKKVSSEKGAIGYSYYYYMTKSKNSNDVKLIAVNGVKPNKKTIGYAQYPLTTYTYAIVTTEKNATSYEDTKTAGTDFQTDTQMMKLEFIKWVLSEDGQKLAEEKGFIRHNNK
ncbi:PstS family phosphate ABC transporter substrate-binding protein [Aminipila terrae]|uniref:PBP domain-containing protein n=1 Tax=Aminipila terrae TaxID=2697030 RepID=A0A6P1M9L7_9FIRM|nr:substrate-binding domain-containing protein [Aminipila terrae]QHI71429.1 hypothetical protein Ami3637_02670 [Aminipila terrae]